MLSDFRQQINKILLKLWFYFVVNQGLSGSSNLLDDTLSHGSYLHLTYAVDGILNQNALMYKYIP